MLYLKTCKCGSNDFYLEDDYTWRCQECERVAEFGYVKDRKDDENENTELV